MSDKIAPIGQLAIALRWLRGENNAQHALILAVILTLVLAAGIGILLL